MFYTIQSVHSRSVFDVPSEKAKPVQQWEQGGVGKRNQQFLFEDGEKADQYRLVSRSTDAPLRVEKTGVEEGARLMKGSRDDASRSDFRFVRVGGSDKYQIVAVHSNLALQVQGGSKDNGVPIVQVTPGTHPSLQFEFIDPQPTGRTASIEAVFTRILDFKGNDIPDDKIKGIKVQLFFLWRENGADKFEYRELVRKGTTKFDFPKGSTRIAYEAKYEDAFNRPLGTFRGRLRLDISLEQSIVGMFETRVKQEEI
jgi:hypothetical protein